MTETPLARQYRIGCIGCGVAIMCGFAAGLPLWACTLPLAPLAVMWELRNAEMKRTR